MADDFYTPFKDNPATSGMGGGGGGKTPELDYYSTFTDNPAGEPSHAPESGLTFGDQTFSAGADATKTPVYVEEVQFSDHGEEAIGGIDMLSPAPSAIGKAPGSGS